MKETITYIFRKPDPRYKSIEGLFHHLKASVAAYLNTTNVNLQFSGGGIKTVFSNLIKFKKDKDRIYHITGDVHYMAIVTGKKSVLTIHDVQSVLNRNFIKRLYLKLFWFWLPALFVKRITVISNFTKLELEKVVPFAKHKIRVVPNPVNDCYEFSDYSFNTAKPRILLLGTKQNKNLERVIKALDHISCEIVIIGQLTDDQNDFLNTFDLNFQSKFDLNLDEVMQEYKACDLLCFASTYEGFGMPIIEAQAVGRPVVTSNIGAMKEVAGDAAVLVDPFKVESIRKGVLKIIEDKALRDDLIKKGRHNIKRFKTDAIVNDYMAIYKEVVSNT